MNDTVKITISDENETTELFTGTAVETTDPAVIQPMNFITNSKYMGKGMLIIFSVMLVIIALTTLLNKVFSRPQKIKVKKEKGKEANRDKGNP